MRHSKNGITRYYKPLLILSFLSYFIPWLISWDVSINNIPIYPLVTQTYFPIIGVILIVLGVISKKIGLILFGLIYCFAFWINLFILFGLLPILGN